MKCNTNRSGRDQFDQAAHLYDEVRLGYPIEIFDAIKEYARLQSGSSVLEIGLGSGQATRTLLKQGYHVVGIEPGKRFCAMATATLQRYPHFKCFNAYFESFQINERFDLVTSATAFHWVDPVCAYQKSWELLKDGGVLAPFWTMMPTVGDSIESMLKTVFDHYAPQLIESTFGAPMKDALVEGEEEMRATGLFSDLQFFHHEWQHIYTAEAYTKLLDTYANFQCLEPDIKEQVFSAIRGHLEHDFGGEVMLDYLTALHMGRK